MLSSVLPVVCAAVFSLVAGRLFARGGDEAVKAVVERNIWLENRLASSELGSRSLTAVAIIVCCGLAVSLFEIWRLREGGANAPKK